MNWYVLIDGIYHITRTNISECQCECGKGLKSGMQLEIGKPRADLICLKCEAIYKPIAIGPTSLPHYLEAENAALKERVAELEAGLDRLHGQLGELRPLA